MSSGYGKFKVQNLDARIVMDGKNLECVSRDGEERRILNQADGFRKIFDGNDEIRNFFN